jgi:uncharacterized protein (DUF2147 family)
MVAGAPAGQILVPDPAQRAPDNDLLYSARPPADLGTRGLSKEFAMKMSFSAAALALMATLIAALPVVQPQAAVPSVSPVGLWRTFDDKTGKPGGLLRIYEQQGSFFARIEQSATPSDAARLCTACLDERKNKPFLGLVIMRNMKLGDGVYEGGDILDPRSGSIYGCKFRLEQGGSLLVVRGFVGISLFGRSQTWAREE